MSDLQDTLIVCPISTVLVLCLKSLVPQCKTIHSGSFDIVGCMFDFMSSVVALLNCFVVTFLFSFDISQAKKKNILFPGNAGDKKIIQTGGRKFIFFNRFSWDIFFSFAFFVFLLFFCLFVSFLKLNVYILIQIRLCGRVSDKKCSPNGVPETKLLFFGSTLLPLSLLSPLKLPLLGVFALFSINRSISLSFPDRMFLILLVVRMYYFTWWLCDM